MKAIVLAAGFGSRMGELTKDCPKPLLKVGETPILKQIIGNLKKVGVTHIGFNLHYHAEQIKEFLGDGSQFGIQVETRFEPEPSGTAGGVKIFEDFLQDEEHFFVVYGDIFTDQDFNPLVEKIQDFDLVLFGHQRKKSNSYILVDSHGKVDKFLERPSQDIIDREIGNRPFYINSAIYLMRRRVLELIPPNEFCDFPKDIFPQLISEGKLGLCSLEGNRVAIDTAEKLNQARELFKQQRSHI